MADVRIDQNLNQSSAGLTSPSEASQSSGGGIDSGIGVDLTQYQIPNGEGQEFSPVEGYTGSGDSYGEYSNGVVVEPAQEEVQQEEVSAPDADEDEDRKQDVVDESNIYGGRPQAVVNGNLINQEVNTGRNDVDEVVENTPDSVDIFSLYESSVDNAGMTAPSVTSTPNPDTYNVSPEVAENMQTPASYVNKGSRYGFPTDSDINELIQERASELYPELYDRKFIRERDEADKDIMSNAMTGNKRLIKEAERRKVKLSERIKRAINERLGRQQLDQMRRINDINDASEPVSDAAEVFSDIKAQALKTITDNDDPNYQEYSPSPRQNAVTGSDYIFPESERDKKERAGAKIAEKSWDGNAFTEKAIAKDTIQPCDVGVGHAVILDIIREPGNRFLEKANEAIGSNYTVDQLLTDPNIFKEFADAFNKAGGIDVVSTKSPVVGSPDTHTRRMKIVYGRGIWVHPTQTKLWTLDFDGDGISISFDLSNHQINAVNYLVNQDGKSMIDTKYWIIPTIDKGKTRNFKEAVKYKLSHISSIVDVSGIADAFYDIYFPSPKSSDDKYMEAYTNDLWVKLLNEMRDVSFKFSNPDVAMSDMLKKLYEFSRQVNQNYTISTGVRIEGVDGFNLNGVNAQESPNDEVLRIVIGDMQAGKLPPNFQDFIRMMHQYAGEIPGKNVYFRLGAKYAKAIHASTYLHMDDAGLYRVGSEEELFNLYKDTLTFGMTQFMSERESIGERVLYAKEVAKRAISESVKIENYRFDTPKGINAFLKRFSDEWNQYMRIVDISNTRFSNEIDYLPDPDYNELVITGNTLFKYIKPLLTVYGDYTLESFFREGFKFDNESIEKNRYYKLDKENSQMILFEHYRTMTLSEFAKHNRIPIPTGQKPGSRKDSEASNFDLFFALASQKTNASISFATRTFKPLVEMFTDHFKTAEELFKKNEDQQLRDDSRAYNQAIADSIVSALHLSSKKMFDHFDMINVKNFMNGKWGRIISDAIKWGSQGMPGQQGIFKRNVDNRFNETMYTDKSNGFKPVKNTKKHEWDSEDYVGGVHYSMTFEYRMSRVREKEKQLDEFFNSEEFLDHMLYGDTDKAFDRVQSVARRIWNEYETIASSSPLWELIVAEIRDEDTSDFDDLVARGANGIEGHGSACNAKEKRKDNVVIKSSGCGFWEQEHKLRREGKGRYNGLHEVLEDPYVPKHVKEQIAVDVLRWHFHYNDISINEIGYQLYMEPSAEDVSMNLMAYHDQPSIVTDMNKGISTMKRTNLKAWDTIQQEVERAYHDFGDPGLLESFISELADNPGLYVDIPKGLVVDAISAQMNKTASSGEKAKSEIANKALHIGLSEQDGGMTDAQYRVEMRAFGYISESMLSGLDIIKVLADPNLKFTVFNGNFSYELSRESLCGGEATEEAMWEMLRNNPRIVSLLRCHTVRANKTGRSVYKTAESGFYDSFNTVMNMARECPEELLARKIRASLLDHPMFDALVAMFVPVNGKNSRSINVRENQKDMINAIIYRLITCVGIRERNVNVPIEDLLKGGFNITIEDIQSKGELNLDEATNWYNDICDRMNVYIDYVSDEMKAYRKKNGATLEAHVFRNMFESGFNESLRTKDGSKPDLDYDGSSVRLAMDCRQSFTGAKTETSTGVEGNITALNLGTALWSCTAKGRHVIIDSSMSRDELSQYIGLMTNAGQLQTNDGRLNIEELEDSLPDDEPLVVEVPIDWVNEGWEKQDATLWRGLDQITTLGKYVSLLRGLSAERLNLQARKAGDDGKDSITKTSRYDDQAQANRKAVVDAYNEGGLFKAKVELARILKRVNEEEGFEDLDLSDYMDLADIMLREVNVDENGQGGEIIIRTIGQISATIRNNIDSEFVHNHTIDQIVAEAQLIADSVGITIGMQISGEEARYASLIAASKINEFAYTGKYRSTLNKLEGSEETIYQTMIELTTRNDNLQFPWEDQIRDLNGDIRSTDQLVDKDQIGKDRIKVHTVKQLEYRAKQIWGEDEKKNKSKSEDKGKDKSEDKSKGKSKDKDSNLKSRGRAGKKPVKPKGNNDKDKKPKRKTGIRGWDKPKNFGKSGNNLYWYPVNISRSGKDSNDSITNNISPGPQSVWVIEDGVSQAAISEAVTKCYAFGMTLAFHAPNGDSSCQKILGDYYYDIFKDDLTVAPFGNDFVMIPFFHIRNSGGSINPPMTPASGDVYESWYSAIEEDDDNFWGLGDTQMLVNELSIPRLKARATGVETIQISDLFHNLMNCHHVDEVTGYEVCDLIHDVRFPDFDEIRQEIIEYAKGNKEGPYIDFGITVNNEHWENHKDKFALQLQEYLDAFEKGRVDENGFITTGCRPDRIIGWVRCNIGDDPQPCYAPIIMSPTGTSNTAPTRFDADITMQDGDIGGGRPRFCIDIAWTLTESVEGQGVKVLDASNYGAKAYALLSGSNIGTFVDGTIIDFLVPAEMNTGRKIGTEPRLNTMKSLAREAKIRSWGGFNFAELEDSFPNNPEFKEAMRTRYIYTYEWQMFMDRNFGNVVFSNDPELNEFVKGLVDTALKAGISPTDLLASRVTNEDGTYSRFLRYVDYDFFFEPNDEFENNFLKFYNRMIPFLCPPSIDGFGDGFNSKGERYMYKPSNIVDDDNRFEHGVLRKLCPRPDGKGGTVWVWSKVYIDLNVMNDEFTGMKKPGLNGSHNSLERMSALAISGKKPISKSFIDYATAPTIRSYSGKEMELDRENFLKRER